MKSKKTDNKLKHSRKLKTKLKTKSPNSDSNSDLDSKSSSSNSSSNLDALSDELNNIVGIKKNDIVGIKKNNKFNVENEFDIGIILQSIQSSLFIYKCCKIIGEVIKFKISGENAWVDIKCKEYQLTGVFWKITSNSNYSKLKTISSGDQLNLTGNFSIMKNKLSIYFNIKSIEKNGKGDYLDMHEQNRNKIKKLNLRQPKKQITKFPYTIGIITALEGAAIQDIIQTLKLDKFIGNIIIKNSVVQGAQCPNSIINSIEWFEQNYLLELDLLMITRGGGSYEDLVGFSDWDLLMRISTIPFVTFSAIGHQIDSQLSDEVSDYNFATPSIGAKYIVETQNKYKKYLDNYANILNNILNNYSNSKVKFNSITKTYPEIIKRYEIKDMLDNLKKYQFNFNKILSNYTILKKNFYSNLIKLKPTITRNNLTELISINNFVNIHKDKEIKPKKIEINFIDGQVKLSYKIIEYVQF